MVGAPVGVDHEVGRDIGPGRLYENMHPGSRAATADRVADHPAHGIACGDRPGADQRLAFLQGDVGHLPRLGIDLEQCAFAIGIALDRVLETGILGLDTGGIVRRPHMPLGVRGRGAARGSGGGLPRWGRVSGQE